MPESAPKRPEYRLGAEPLDPPFRLTQTAQVDAEKALDPILNALAAAAIYAERAGQPSRWGPFR